MGDYRFLMSLTSCLKSVKSLINSVNIWLTNSKTSNTDSRPLSQSMRSQHQVDKCCFPVFSVYICVHWPVLIRAPVSCAQDSSSDYN